MSDGIHSLHLYSGYYAHLVKGYALTPTSVVDRMVDKLFGGWPPERGMRVLDPGCGTGVFIDGVIRWCAERGRPTPNLVGIDSDPTHIKASRARFSHLANVKIQEADFLNSNSGSYDFIIGNPPYVPITGLSDSEREFYRRRYATARGRFDLYLLFFEKALRLLKPGGRLVFITPEKFLYVNTAAPLRELLSRVSVDELHFVSEETFGDLVTYPLITTVTNSSPGSSTAVILRSGFSKAARLPPDASSWLPAVLGATPQSGSLTLSDVCSRVSCGVATGADSVYVVRQAELDPRLRDFAYPTIAGRHLERDRPATSRHFMLVPYDGRGKLIAESRLGTLRQYLSAPSRREKLLARTCVQRKPWYAFHETPPLREMLKPKLLCKDISPAPFFVMDESGSFVPRHSVYYIIPREPDRIAELAAYLNSPVAQQWLRDHCQRAANGFLRLQSHILKRLPVPETLVPVVQDDLFLVGAK